MMSTLANLAFVMCPMLGGVLTLILAAVLFRAVNVYRATAAVKNPKTRIRVFLEALHREQSPVFPKTSP